MSLGGSICPECRPPVEVAPGVGIEPEADVELLVDIPGLLDAGELALIKSAAILTFVGTLLSRMAPLPMDDVEVEEESSEWWDLGGLNGDDSDSAVHGDGRGLRGDIIEAEVESDGMCVPFRDARGPPIIGILRRSPPGCRNSLGRRCLDGLCSGSVRFHDQTTWNGKNADEGMRYRTRGAIEGE